MAIIRCPNCQGKLRFPDDSPPRKVKCPSCTQTFLADPNGPIAEGEEKPAPKEDAPPKPDKKVGDDFDVVDEKPARSKRRDDDDDDSRDRKKKRNRDDEDDDKPRSKRRDEDDDDDDRDRKKRRDRDDDDDDKPRSKRRDDDDEDDDRDRKKKRNRDDDDDDRPRSRSRDRDDDDDDDRGRRRKRRDADDDDDRRPKETAAQYRNARQGVGLASIGLWCQVGAVGVLIFLMLISYIGDAYQTAYDMQLLAGLPGLANWVVALVGFSFLIAGPKKGNMLGLSIALVAVAAIHLFLVVYLTFDKGSSGGQSSRYSYGGSRVLWDFCPTQLHHLMILLVLGRIFDTWYFLTAVFEIGRFILFMLVLKELGRVSKDKDISKSAGGLVVLMPAGLGVIVLLYLIIKVIAKETGGSNAIFFMLITLELGAYIALYSMAALLCGKTKDAIAFRRK